MNKNIKYMYELTPMQEGMLYHNLVDKNSMTYFQQCSFEVKGKIKIDLIQQSFDNIISRHDVLRTSFIYKKVKSPIQVVLKERKNLIMFEDISFLSEKEVDRYIYKFKEEDRKKGFDLTKDKLIRLSILKINNSRYCMIWSFHHIIMDGWCMGLVLNEFLEYYSRLLSGETIELKKATPFKQYVNWLGTQNKQNGEKYWTDYLKGFAEKTGLLENKSIQKVRYKQNILDCVIDEETTKKIQQLAKENRVTLNTVFKAIWGLLLQKYNNTNDAIFGNIVSNRPPNIEGVEEMLGIFINAVPVRVKTNEEMTITELLKKLQEQGIVADKFSYMPLAEIQSKNVLKSELINHLMVFENYPLENVQRSKEEDDLTIIKGSFNIYGETNYDLNIIIIPGKTINIKFKYNANKYGDQYIKTVSSHIKTIANAIVKQPEIKISEIEMLSEEEKTQIIYDFNDTKMDYPEEKTVHELFEEQAEKNPENVAVKFNLDNLTYSELNARANQLARILRNKGVKPNSVVAIMVNNSLNLIIGILGVLKAGGAYLPIDPNYPKDRIEYMLEDSGTKLILSEKSLVNGISFSEEVIDIFNEELYVGDCSNVNNINTSSDLAYIIYTSGTTGKPKGVMVNHYNLVNYCSSIVSKLSLTAEDETALLSSYAFDLGYTAIFSSLVIGSTLHLIKEDDYKNPEKLVEYLMGDITYIKITPSIFNMIINSGCARELKRSKLRLIILGGESINIKDIEKFLSLGVGNGNIQIVNHYGPTEATIGCIATFVDLDNLECFRNIIGRPINNNKAYIIDRNRKLCGVNIPGELCISGEGLTRGYLNRPELTGDKFIDNPFEGRKKMYRTGDLARWLPDGNIEFLGRIDQQVKIRGFRVELGEIESRLASHEEIKEAVVLAKENEEGNKYLCAYLVTYIELTVRELRRYLSKTLPDYMIPTKYIRLDKMPVTSNGKVNRKALPVPEGNMETGVEYAPPTNEIQEKLVQVWEEVLGVNRVGINDNFFDMGGHSLKAIKLMSKIHKIFNVEVPLSEIFNRPVLKELAKYIKIDSGSENEYIQIQRVEEKPYYLVSSAQKRLYLLEQMEGIGTSYNIPSAMIIEGEFAKERVEEAFKALLLRHESLRTSFNIIDDEIVQIVNQEVKFSIMFKVLSNLLNKNDSNETIDLNNEVKEFIKPFDLSSAPLLRLALIRLTKERHLLIFDMHHIISDAISKEILIREFISYYEGRRIQPLSIQYKDYSEWQKRQLKKEQIKKQKEYWIENLEGELPVLNMPFDYERSTELNFEGDRVEALIDKQLTKKIKLLKKETDTTIYMVLLATFNILLHKYTGDKDIMIGTPIAGRSHADLHNIIGVFINTLVLRNKPEASKKFVDFLTEVKENSLKAYENQDYQFEDLVEQLNITREANRNPIFDIMFALQNISNRRIELEGLTFKPYELQNNVSKFDLTLTALEETEDILLSWQYSTKLFKKETIERMSVHYINILKEVLNNIDIEISEIEMLSEEEKTQIIYDFNDTKMDYPKEKTVHKLFEEQAEKKPENVAVKFNLDNLTYSELNARANQLARILRNKGVKPNSVVAIMVNNSLNLIIGILGVLKAGGAYLPIDPNYPKDRIEYMLEDSGTKLILSEKSLVNGISFSEEVIDIFNEELYVGDCSNVNNINTSSDLAYIIYTSGTTGKPKGVMVNHYNLVNYCSSIVSKLSLTAEDETALLSSYAFDLGYTAIFSSLVIGSTLHLIKEDDYKNPEKLVEYLMGDITYIKITPSIFNMIINSGCARELKRSKLRLIILGGESINIKDIEKFLSLGVGNGNIQIVNHYGPTEATIGCIATFVDLDNLECFRNIIGRPINNNKAYIIDRNRKLCGVNIPGELCISGEGLTRGYLNRPELTGDKFIDNPFEGRKKMYRTGDLARWLPDGNIEFLGRIDQQVKIRGFRVELGEIESRLVSHEEIKEAVVLAKENEEGNKYLCAYLVTNIELTVRELRRYLSKTLPDYMIPTKYIRLAKMPVTSNGKVNRKALPVPEGNMDTGVEYAPPTNEIQEKLVQVWEGLLGGERIGIDVNFFDVGGDSIKAIQVVSRLKQYGFRLELNDVLKNLTIRQLSEKVKKNISNQADQGIVEGEVKLTPIQISFFNNKYTQMNHWNQAVMLFRGEGFDYNAVTSSFNKIIEHHDALRMIYKFEDGQVKQYNRGCSNSDMYALEVVDFSYEIDYKKRIEKEANRVQGSIDLEKGPLVKLGLMKTAKGDHLLIVIHHLVIDGISWRIILEDFKQAYQMAITGEEIVLNSKTESYKNWALSLERYAKESNLSEEKVFWQTIYEKPVERLIVDHVVEKSIRKDSNTVTIAFTQEQTTNLIKRANQAYNTQINDLLLTSLGIALNEWMGYKSILVDLEGHGRENIMDDIDISRTVGWFTSKYPVVLEDCNLNDISNSINKIKQNIRDIPHKGIHHNILRYLTEKENNRKILFKNQLDISFNYLGQFNEDIENEVFGISEISTGESMGKESEMYYKLSINGIVVGNKLTLDITYNKQEYNLETIKRLAEVYKSTLSKVIEHCISKEEITYKLLVDNDKKIDIEDYTLLNKKRQKCIFAFPPAMGLGAAYHKVAKCIDSHTLYSFEFIEHEDRIKIYADYITKISHEQSYILMGYSAGGNLAFEVAKELELRGRDVSAIIMIDAHRKDKVLNKDKLVIDDATRCLIENYLHENTNEHMSVEDVISTFGAKIQSYHAYFCDLINYGKVNCNIYVLQDSTTKKDDLLPKWAESTMGKLEIVKGIGEHENLLSELNYVKHNVKIINTFLRRISNR
ncbi:non-ribosomal peptide synthetase [Oceanirhabdus sp. W0125-5]|uniref:non-ribosomal peptide synthetase n=1 Tax=Oceanirhabdus sp. W0125-5 TaxID=2999116 RepID=UPI0022F2E8D4|nr:non-ribosomal peptide synthetase [Oceanirhabdus sp. W0125-5]WBW99496.1 amino acid adenylation domain-containing protein [Oceanirhabdus sp. W0125-5]